MQFTVTLNEISLLIIAVAFLVLVIYLIPTVIQLKKTTKEVEKLTTRGAELIDDIDKIVHRTSYKASEMGASLRNIIDSKGTEKAAQCAMQFLIKRGRLVTTLIGVIAGARMALQLFNKNSNKKEGK